MPVKTIEYVGGYVMENNKLSYYGMAEGRVRNDGPGIISTLDLKMEYFITDHQGNTRVSFEDDGTYTNTAMVTQENSYYAFGMQMAGGYTPTNPNKKLYNAGSEWQDDIDGLADYYNTFFRDYDPVIGRFNGVDPMSESFESWTTYHYSYNNPINFNDPMGDYAAARDMPKWIQDMQAEYNSWHDSRYGNNLHDRSWHLSDGGAGYGGGGGGGSMTEFDFWSTYTGLKMRLNDLGTGTKHGFDKWGNFGYWQKFVGDNYDGGENAMTGVTVGSRFISLGTDYITGEWSKKPTAIINSIKEGARRSKIRVNPGGKLGIGFGETEYTVKGSVSAQVLAKKYVDGKLVEQKLISVSISIEKKIIVGIGFSFGGITNKLNTLKTILSIPEGIENMDKAWEYYKSLDKTLEIIGNSNFFPQIVAEGSFPQIVVEGGGF